MRPTLKSNWTSFPCSVYRIRHKPVLHKACSKPNLRVSMTLKGYRALCKLHSEFSLWRKQSNRLVAEHLMLCFRLGVQQPLQIPMQTIGPTTKQTPSVYMGNKNLSPSTKTTFMHAQCISMKAEEVLERGSSHWALITWLSRSSQP